MEAMGNPVLRTRTLTLVHSPAEIGARHYEQVAVDRNGDICHLLSGAYFEVGGRQDFDGWLANDGRVVVTRDGRYSLPAE